MNLAWLDLQTTHTDERYGTILELGAVVTDPRLDVVDEFTTVVASMRARWFPPGEERERVARESGLLADIDRVARDRNGTGPRDLERADAALVEVLDCHTVDGAVTLGGCDAAAFTARWVRAHLPRTARRLGPVVYDVGVLREWIRAVDPALVRERDRTFRALPDAYAALGEWRVYTAAARRAARALREAADDPHVLA